jgi:plastocyanin
MALAIALLVAGCGVSVDSGPAGTEPTGDVAFTITWPARGRSVPLAANSVTVTLYRPSGAPLLTRVQGRGLTTTDEVRLSSIPAGAYTFNAIAYPGFKGDGVAVGIARGTVTVTAGQTSPLPISMNSTVTALSIETPRDLYVGETLSLVWRAVDAQQQTVMVDPRDMSWRTGNTLVAGVTSLGVLTATGVGSTTATITLPGVAAASATVRVLSGIRVVVAPASVTLRTGDTATFAATVTGSAIHTVHWSVQEAGGGSIDAGGRYTAPATTGEYHVVAASDADGTATAIATVHVVDTGALAMWTVLVYMDADNNLEPYAVGAPPDLPGDFAKIATGGASSLVRVLVQLDRAEGSPWSDTRRFEVRKNTALDATPRVDNPPLGELNMGDPNTLSDFIAWGQQYAPAQHYLLVLWDHGSGWRTRGRLPRTRGICQDETSGGATISTPGLADALAGHQPIDVLLTDACLMQMAEVGFEIRSSVTYLVADEGSTPATGSQYQLWLADLVDNPLSTPRALAQNIARRTSDFYGTQTDISLSVVETAKLVDVATAVHTMSTALQANTLQATLLAGARNAAQNFADPIETLDGLLYYEDYRDLYDYAAQVSSRLSWLAGPVAGVQAAVQAAVVADFPSAQRPRAHGITIFVPPPARFSAVALPYRALAFNQVTHWDAWLAAQPE